MLEAWYGAKLTPQTRLILLWNHIFVDWLNEGKKDKDRKNNQCYLHGMWLSKSCLPHMWPKCCVPFKKFLLLDFFLSKWYIYDIVLNILMWVWVCNREKYYVIFSYLAWTSNLLMFILIFHRGYFQKYCYRAPSWKLSFAQKWNDEESSPQRNAVYYTSH